MRKMLLIYLLFSTASVKLSAFPGGDSELHSIEVQRPNFVVRDRNLSRVERWAVPTDSGITEAECTLVGKVQETPLVGGNTIGAKPFQRQPPRFLAATNFAKGFDLAGNEVSKKPILYFGAADVPQDPRVSENSQPAASAKPAQAVPVSMALPIQYRNDKYGFCFSLPEDWKGFSIIQNGQWQGYSNLQPKGDTKVAEGPTVIIRHPRWTSDIPRQDIPIMVFTKSQWYSVNHPDQSGGFIISAAPFGPEELGRNHRYVFALPPRYNYAFPKGYEQVNEIIHSHPLHAPCSSHQPEP